MVNWFCFKVITLNGSHVLKLKLLTIKIISELLNNISITLQDPPMVIYSQNMLDILLQLFCITVLQNVHSFATISNQWFANLNNPPPLHTHKITDTTVVLSSICYTFISGITHTGVIKYLFHIWHINKTLFNIIFPPSDVLCIINH